MTVYLRKHEASICVNLWRHIHRFISMYEKYSTIGVRFPFSYLSTRQKFKGFSPVGTCNIVPAGAGPRSGKSPEQEETAMLGYYGIWEVQADEDDGNNMCKKDGKRCLRGQRRMRSKCKGSRRNSYDSQPGSWNKNATSVLRAWD
jgi:hypothetical protein